MHKRKNTSCYPCHIGSKLVIVDFSGKNIPIVGRGQKHPPNLSKEISVMIRKSKMSVGNYEESHNCHNPHKLWETPLMLS